MRTLIAVLVLLPLLVSSRPVAAGVNPGDTAPPFTKNELATVPFPQDGPVRTLASYAGKVLVIHLLGYN